MTLNNKIRDPFFDIIKASAIYLVILGHVFLECFNYSKFKDGVYSNDFFNVIYSFHMPLFMLISGYFFYRINDPLLEIIKSKFKQLIIPTITFGSIHCLLLFFITKEFFPHLIFLDYWYCKSLFICIIIYVCFYKILKKKLLASIIPIIIIIYFGLGTRYWLPMMYPFFCFGTVLRKCNLKTIFNYKLMLLYVALYVIFYICNRNDIDKYLFSTIFVNIKFYSSTIYYLLIKYSLAILGCLSFMSILYNISKLCRFHRLVEVIGMKTLPIYLLQGIILETLIKNYTNISYNKSLMQCIISCVCSFIILIICYFINRKLERYKFYKTYFIGLKK